MSSRRIVVLISGEGTNLQALLDAQAGGVLDGEIVAVVSNKASAPGLQRAANANVRTEILEAHAGEDRAGYDARLAAVIAPYRPDLVVLAGWMRILSDGFCIKHKIINLHPAKPGAFPGTHAIERSFEAWQTGAISEAGVMVHWVPDSSVDTGPVISWRPVPFADGDTLEEFVARVHAVEHELLVPAVGAALDSVQTGARKRTIDLTPQAKPAIDLTQPHQSRSEPTTSETTQPDANPGSNAPPSVL